MYIVLDTNILLHFRSFEEIPLSEEIGCEDVTIILTSVVMEEIDRIKDNERGKVQKRAKAISRRLGEILVDSKSSRYTIEYVESPFATEEEKQHYQLDRNDNRILFAVLKKGFTKEGVCAVSNDNTMLIRAKQFGFKVHRLDEKYRLQEELTQEEKDAKAAIAELERIKNRMPDPYLMFEQGGDHIQIYRTIPKDKDAVVQKEMEELKAKWPKETVRKQEQYFNGYIFHNPTPEEVVTYNTSLEKFLTLSEKKIRLEAHRDDLNNRMVRISIMINNKGTAPTGKMNIFLKFSDNAQIYFKDSKKIVEYEQPPTPNYNRFLNSFSLGGAPYIPTVKMWDLDRFYEKNELQETMEPLNHNLKKQVFEFYVDSATCPNFQMKWFIADAALIDPVKGELNVSFE